MPSTPSCHFRAGEYLYAGQAHDDAIARLRWSQSGNFGRLPNAAMPNTFLAHAKTPATHWCLCLR